MAILALPLITSILKPHKTHFSFLPLPIILHRRFFSKSSTVSALSTSSSSHVSHNSEHQKKASVPTFQQSIQRLQEYWGSVGCAVMQCSNTEVGAGTMNPLTYLRVLGPEPWNVA